MRHAIELLVSISLSLGIDSATADDRGWYIGIGVGGVVADYGIADFDDGSISEGLVDNSDIDDTTGYFIGVRGEAERYFNMGATDQDVVALSIVYNF